MLMAYMDDSGTHPEAHNCVIAGYWGSVREWRYFEFQWNEVLRSERITEFKANEFWFRFPDGGRVRPYQGWSDKRHQNFIGQLLTILENRNLTPFAYGFVASEWKNQPELLRRIYAGVQATDPKARVHPVIMPLSIAIARTAYYCKPGKVMHYVMDNDPRIARHAVEVFAHLKRSGKEDGDPVADALGSLTFDDSRKVPGLQAADLLAYEAHRFAKKESAAVSMREEYRRALSHMRSIQDFQLFDKQRFANLQRALAETVKRNEEAERIQDLRQDHAPATEGSALRDKGQAGRGKGSKKAET